MGRGVIMEWRWFATFIGSSRERVNKQVLIRILESDYFYLLGGVRWV